MGVRLAGGFWATGDFGRLTPGYLSMLSRSKLEGLSTGVRRKILRTCGPHCSFSLHVGLLDRTSYRFRFSVFPTAHMAQRVLAPRCDAVQHGGDLPHGRCLGRQAEDRAPQPAEVHGQVPEIIKFDRKFTDAKIHEIYRKLMKNHQI